MIDHQRKRASLADAQARIQQRHDPVAQCRRDILDTALAVAVIATVVLLLAALA